MLVKFSSFRSATMSSAMSVWSTPETLRLDEATHLPSQPTLFVGPGLLFLQRPASLPASLPARAGPCRRWVE